MERICWSKWNMVEGPLGSNRTDDPNKVKSDLDDFRFGGSQSARSRVTDLVALFNATTVALRAEANEDPAFNALKKQFVGLKHLCNKEIIKLEESMWEVVTPGRYDKFGNAERHTTWRKAAK